MGNVNIKKEVFLGFFIALIITAFCSFMYLEFFSGLRFKNGLKQIRDLGMLEKVIALSALPNVVVFFVLMNKNQMYRARGIVMAIILITLVIFSLQVL